MLCQQFAAHERIGWTSTDVLYDLLRVGGVVGVKNEWDASREAIASHAEWFYPYLQRLTWSVNSLADHYVIEGVGILPKQVKQLSEEYKLRAVFLGNSQMTVERLDAYPGRSRGYAELPIELKYQIATDVPQWSEYVAQEAEAYGYGYVDTGADFERQLQRAEAMLLAEVPNLGSF